MTFEQLIVDPITYPFMQRALIAAIMVGAISGVIGCFVVIRGMSFFGEALAHSILPGVATAYIFTTTGILPPLIVAGADLSLFAGGMVAGVFSALGIGWLTRNNRLREDTAIGIVFVAMFALGIAIISSDERAYGRNLVEILFGNILGISPTDMVITLVCGIVVLVLIVMFYKELMIISFDLSLARTLKLPAEPLRYLLLILIAVTIIASLQTVGIALMLAMLIVPAATAQLVTQRLHWMMLVSVIVGVIGAIIGIYVSYHVDIATSPTIVLTVTAIFVVVFTLSQVRKLLVTAEE